MSIHEKRSFFFLFSRLGQLHPMNNFFCRLCAYCFFLQGSIFLLNSTVTPFLRIKISDIRILISDLVHSCSILRTTHYAKTFVVLEKRRCQMNSRGKPMVFGLQCLMDNARSGEETGCPQESSYFSSDKIQKLCCGSNWLKAM